MIVVVVLAVMLRISAPAHAQQLSASEQPADAAAPQEAGGRLVVSGETVIVTGELVQVPHDASIATKIDTPLLMTPRSVSILDRQTLDDLAATNISQAHDYAVNVTPLDERGPAVSRGFPVDFYDLRRDGLRTYSWSVREPVALDRVQYLRGPAALFYGDGSPGAIVNLVLKKPLPVRRTEMSVSLGNLGFQRFTVDSTGPFGANRAARYRLIGAGEWLDNGYDNDERRLTFFPTFSLDLGARATLSADAEFYDQRGRNYRHVVPVTAAAQDGDFSRIPWDLSVASPTAGWTGSNVAPGARADVRLGDRTSLHVAGRYTRIDGDLNLEALLGLSPDGRTANRFHYREISTWDEYQADAFVSAVRATGPIEHRLVGGVEAGLSSTDSQIGVGPASPLDIYNPQYAPLPPDVALSPVRYNVRRIGFYGADQVRLSNNVTIVPGLRWSHLQIDDRVAASNPGSASEAGSSDSVVSPSVGIVVLTRPWFSVYSTYSQGFVPPSPGQYLEDGRAPELARTSSVEGGVKADLGGQRLSATASVFRIGQTNVPEADVRGFYRQIGEAESRGLEFEVVGRIAPDLSMRGGYGWTRTEITRDLTGFTGHELPNAPSHTVNLWLRYQHQGGPLAGLMLAAGVVHVSERFAARDNLVVVPNSTRFDASGWYDLRGGLKLGVSAENFTNVRYVTSGNNSAFIAGSPRRLAVQLTAAF